MLSICPRFQGTACFWMGKSLKTVRETGVYLMQNPSWCLWMSFCGGEEEGLEKGRKQVYSLETVILAQFPQRQVENVMWEKLVKSHQSTGIAWRRQKNAFRPCSDFYARTSKVFVDAFKSLLPAQMICTCLMASFWLYHRECAVQYEFFLIYSWGNING